MNLREYAEGKNTLYADFAKTISRIVRVSIDKANIQSRLQAIQVRAKEVQSLRKKLEARGLLASDEVESQIKDLAGCRLIFYTNNDVNAFLSSGLIVDNFDVDWDKSKIHEPLDEQQPAYVATHYVVALKKDRLALPEYEAFAGLQCEIQVQSILNHAWAETSHDITYKKPTISGFGSKQFESIERRMQKIMTDHLLPAGYEFQKIQQDFEKMLQGQELIGAGGLDRLATCSNNNERFELLERFHDYVLPQYDDVAAAFPGIRRQLIQAVQDSRKAAPSPIVTPFGEFPGKSSDDVTDMSLNILERVRYVDVDNMFSALCELYVGKKTDAEGERILKSVEGLAEHNLDVWKMAGPFVQSRICARVAALGPSELEALLPVVVKALSQVLSAEAESTSSDYSTLTLRRAPVQPSDSLAQVRKAAIELLAGMYSTRRTEQQRRMILSALWQATDVPHLGRSHDALDVMILSDAARVVTFLLGIVDSESFEVTQHLEHQAFWLFKRYKKWADEDNAHTERSRASKELLRAIEALRDRINRNDEFVIYKTLVGFESIFLPHWSDPTFDHRAEDKFRNDKVAEFVQSINPDSEEQWKRRIVRCAHTESIDLATFPYFGQFLYQLAKSKPETAVRWVSDLDSRLERFLPSLLRGLRESTSAGSVRDIVDGWITEGAHLAAIARTIRFSDGLDVAVLKRLVAAAITRNDAFALTDVIATIFEKCTPENFNDLAPIGLEVIRHCTSVGEHRWIYEAWIRLKESPFIGLAQAEHVEAMLKTAEALDSIDYHVEALLAAIAKRYPAQVVELIGKRFRKERGEKEHSKYEAIPFRFHEIDEVLREHPQPVMELARNLFDEDRVLFEFRGGRFVHNVFPTINDEISRLLRKEVADGGEARVDFVLQILRNYEGEPFLHEIAKDIVDVLDVDDKRLNLVEIVLESTGTTTGEFGLRDAYLRKKAEVAPWLADERAKVRSFASRYMRTLDRQIAAEQRRAQEDIEMRKRDYGETDDGA